MILWGIFGALVLLAVTTLLAPLLFTSTENAGRREGALAIFADQIAEVQADRDRRLISAEEAQAAIVEIKRRMLALGHEKGTGIGVPEGSGRGPLILAAILVPVSAVAFYGLLGSPETPSLAFADRQEEQAEAAEIATLAGRLRDRLVSDETGGPAEGWDLLGQTYMRMGRYEDAAWAFETLSEKPDANSAAYSRLAEALITSENGIVTPQAQEAIDRAMALDPRNPAAVFYQSVAMDQLGQTGAAYDLLLEALSSADGFAPWMPSFIDQANRIAAKAGRPPVDLSAFAPMAGNTPPGPTSEDVAAASEMTEEDRSAFIRSMVDRLASRLEEEPDDLDGWLRLANAYGVLGETKKAADAYEAAGRLANALPAEDPRRAQVKQGLDALK